ncbi:MAG: hypothetical protein ACREDO_10750 [Methyloceanibacter sp.]
MKTAFVAAFGLLLSLMPALAEPAAEQDGPLSPCVQGGGSDGGGETQSGPPWGVVIATAFTKQQALDEFSQAKKEHGDVLGDNEPILVEQCDLNMGTDLQYSARVGMESRDAADELCAKLRSAGGACVVMKN